MGHDPLCLLFAKEPSSDRLVDWRVGTKPKEVGHTGAIFRMQGKRAGAASLCLWASFQEKSSEPIFDRVDDMVVAAVFFGVRLPSNLPILVFKELIT
jgi:hypothetical protein